MTTATITKQYAIWQPLNWMDNPFQWIFNKDLDLPDQEIIDELRSDLEQRLKIEYIHFDYSQFPVLETVVGEGSYIPHGAPKQRDGYPEEMEMGILRVTRPNDTEDVEIRIVNFNAS